MTLENSRAASPLSDFLAAATRNAGVGSEIAIASSQVIAKRMALGMAAAQNPIVADHVEFGRIIPEKLAAFSAANLAVLQKSQHAGQKVAEFASAEMATTSQAALAMARCATPMAFARAQNSFVRGWFDRASSNLFAMGMMALGTQDAAMAPIRDTVVGNAKRLNG